LDQYGVRRDALKRFPIVVIFAAYDQDFSETGVAVKGGWQPANHLLAPGGEAHPAAGVPQIHHVKEERG
jgi:hypothetical protein